MADVVVPEEANEPIAPGPHHRPAAKPIREVLASPDFRRYWLVQFLAASAPGRCGSRSCGRALDLSDNPAVPGFLGMALDLARPGAHDPGRRVSDRLDRKRLLVNAQVAAAACS